jgi:hypothetical protein
MQISQSTFEEIGELPHLNFEREMVWAKGLGDVPVYIV